VTTATYDADGDLLSMTEPRGNLPGASPGSYTTTRTYNAAGELVSTTDPLGDVTHYTYNQAGLLASITDPGGNVTTYGYNLLGELTSVTSAAGTKEAGTTTYAYGPRGDLVAETNPAGKTTTYAYDALGELASTTNPLGQVTTNTYDAAGKLSSTSEPNGQVVSYAYNPVGELTSVAYPGSGTPPTSYTYDAAGELTGLSRATGSDTYAYEPDGLLAATTDAAGATIAYAYDASGNTTGITYPNGQVVRESYTPDGQVASITDWLKNTTSYTYGPNGNLDTEAFANGITGHFATNAAGETTSLSYDAGCSGAAGGPPGIPPGPCRILYAKSYTYAPTGLLASSTSPTPPGPPSGSSYAYNPLEELSGVTPSPLSPGPASGTTSYAYDPAGNLTGVGFASGASLSLSYNAGSELTAMSLSRQSPTAPSPVATAGFTYNALGERTGENITQPGSPTPPGATPPGSSTTGTNPATPLASLSYGYNPRGEMTSYAGPVGGSPLSIATSAPGPIAPAPPRSSSQGSATYAYDPSGLLQSETSTTTGPPGPACKSPVPPSPSQPPVSPPQLPSCATTTTTAFTWNVAGSLPTAIEVGAYYYVYGPSGTPIEQIGPSSGVLFYLANRQGSTIALSDAKGQVVARYAYSAYGSLICGPSTPPGASPPCQPGSPVPPTSCPGASAKSPAGAPPCLARAIGANRFLYDGQYLDAASGLYYLRARWYDAATGQFTSVDALVAITGAAYGYAGENPLNGGDPSGMLGCGFLLLGNCPPPSKFTPVSVSGIWPVRSPSTLWVYTPFFNQVNSSGISESALDQELSTLWYGLYQHDQTISSSTEILLESLNADAGNYSSGALTCSTALGYFLDFECAVTGIISYAPSYLSAYHTFVQVAGHGEQSLAYLIYHRESGWLDLASAAIDILQKILTQAAKGAYLSGYYPGSQNCGVTI